MTTPRLHQSTDSKYPVLLRISGAMYAILPAIDVKGLDGL